MKLSFIISWAMLSMTSAPQTAESKVNSKTMHPHGINLSYMNRNVNPDTDFFRYAAEGWNKKHPMPADRSRYGVFNLLIDENDTRIRNIIEDMAASKSVSGGLEYNIGSLYNKVVDQKTLNSRGVQPLMKYIAPIERIKSRGKLTAAIARLAHIAVTTFFDLGVEADAENSSMNLVQIYQGGLSLGERDYYTDTDEPTMKVRNAYREFGKKVFEKLYPAENETQTEKRMNDVIKVEAALAEGFNSSAVLRVPENNYRKITVATLKENYPEIELNEFSKSIMVRFLILMRGIKLSILQKKIRCLCQRING